MEPLGMKFFDLAALVFRPFDRIKEHVLHAFNA